VSCDHRTFENKVEVALGEDGQLVASLMLRCKDCREPFFVRSVKSVTDTEVQFVIAPRSSLPAPGSSQLGWKSG